MSVCQRTWSSRGKWLTQDVLLTCRGLSSMDTTTRDPCQPLLEPSAEKKVAGLAQPTLSSADV